MVRPNTLLESLVTACRKFDALPPQVTYATVELDGEGEHSDVSLPLVEFTFDSIERDRSRNTERVGVTYNDDGSEAGYIYAEWYDARIVASVETVPQMDHTHRDLAEQLRKTLYRHDVHGPGLALPDPQNPTENLSGVAEFVTDTVTPANDFGSSPTRRAKTIEIDVAFVHEYTSADLGIEYDVLRDVDVSVNE